MNRALIAWLGIWMSLAAHAMTVEVHGHALYATGPVQDDSRKFQEALARPEVDTVVFVNSPGGDLWTGLRVGRMIAAKGLSTVIAGHCMSACAIMFIGGKERAFSDAFRPAQTFIGIHGAHDTTTRSINPRLQPQIFAFFKQNIAGRFNPAVMNKALYDMDDAGSMLRIFDAKRMPVRVPYHCKSVQSLRKDCTELEGQDALSLGIVTSNTLKTLDLPAGFKQVPSVLGRELTRTFADLHTFFHTLSERQCSDDACRALIADFGSAKEHKALAIPVGAPGVGVAIDRDNATLAFAAAVYVCNHPRDRPARLCETQTVDGFDVRDLYAIGLASHSEALAKLAAPSERFYSNEEYGGGMTSANGLRTQKLRDITPQKLDGIRTFGTQELALALKNSPPPVLIGVAAGVFDAIPGASTLLNGGVAFEDAALDNAFEARFSGLLKLISPDPLKPIVFYCQGRDSWLSANASLRAKKLGYTQVGWYRGGMQGWRTANLPVALVVLKAVAQP